jgi:hypothetical protein
LPRHTQAEATSASLAIRGDRENTHGNLLGMEKSESMGAAALRPLESRYAACFEDLSPDPAPSSVIILSAITGATVFCRCL